MATVQYIPYWTVKFALWRLYHTTHYCSPLGDNELHTIILCGTVIIALWLLYGAHDATGIPAY